MGDAGHPADAVDFKRNYRFSICWENSIRYGYVTEKIVDSWAAGTIPIYHGNNAFEREFNPRALIDVSTFASWDDCIDYVLWLDENPDEYLKIAREPIYTDAKQAEAGQHDRKFLAFFEHIMSLAPDKRMRRDSALSVSGKSYEDMIRSWARSK